MNMKKIETVCFLCIAVIAVAVCTSGCLHSSQGSKTYTRDQAQRQLSVYYGTVLRVSDVKIEAEQTGVGAVAGGVLGGVAGSAIGSGSGSRIGAAAGAVGGMIAGQAAEKSLGKKDGIELEVSLDDGRLIVVVQEKDAQFAVGDRVRIIQSPDGKMRVRQ